MRRRFLALILMLVVATATGSVFAQGRRSLRMDKAKDPVCGMMVDKDPKLAFAYRGETYYFCSRTDLDAFRKSPERFVRK